VLGIDGLNYPKHIPQRDRLIDWIGQFWSIRSYGGCTDAMALASGQLDVWFEPVAAPWDLAPIKLILEEAGARYFTLSGGRSIYEGHCFACTPALEPAVREFLGVAD
jgi:fructose-1,6-bisphosphatase/inositol monophosphatase family enzyme